MKVYVDKLPECCMKCPCMNEDIDYGNNCNISKLHLEWDEYQNFRHQDCPLQSLADYTKQVRKDVCEEVYKKCEPLFRLVNNYDNGDVIERNELVDILEQIQGQNDS